MSWLSKGVDKARSLPIVGGIIDSITGRPAGVRPGANNPFAPPDLSFLKNNPFPTSTSLNLAGQYKPVDYQAPTNTNDAMFNDLLGNINAPSSVDQVQSGVDSERMNELLKGIGIQENNTVGSTKSDFLDRGLGGPGQISDIEANALAQNRSDANTNRTGARLGFANSELDRLKAREDEARGAYGARYAAGTAADTQARDIAAKNAEQNSTMFNDLLGKQGELGQQGELAYAGLRNSRDIQLAQLMSSLYTGAAANQTNAYVPPTPGLFDRIINGFGDSFGSSLGKKAGGG